MVLRLVALAGAIWLTAWILPGVHVYGGVWTYLWVALLFAVVNIVLGPLLHLISLPLTVMTLGLFALVVNAALVGITAAVSKDFAVDGFWSALVAAILIAVFTAVLTALIPDRRPR
jgi:putative membrane protein